MTTNNKNVHKLITLKVYILKHNENNPGSYPLNKSQEVHQEFILFQLIGPCI